MDVKKSGAVSVSTHTATKSYGSNGSLKTKAFLLKLKIKK